MSIVLAVVVCVAVDRAADFDSFGSAKTGDVAGRQEQDDGDAQDDDAASRAAGFSYGESRASDGSGQNGGSAAEGENTLDDIEGPATKGTADGAAATSGFAKDSRSVSVGADQRDYEEVLERFDKGALPDVVTGVPGWFADEVAEAPSQALYAGSSSDGSTVGLVVDGGADRVLDELSSQAKGRGWTQTSGGDGRMRCFARQDGRHRWMAAQASEVGTRSCLVVWVQ